MGERYEIVEVDRNGSRDVRTVVAANLGGDNAIATRDRYRTNVPTGSSIEYRIRAMKD